MVSEAELLGINLIELQSERFDHPSQLKIHREIAAKARAFWGDPQPEHQNMKTITEMSTLTGYSYEQIRRIVHQYGVPCERLGRQFRVDADVLSEILATRRTTKQRNILLR